MAYINSVGYFCPPWPNISPQNCWIRHGETPWKFRADPNKHKNTLGYHQKYNTPNRNHQLQKNIGCHAGLKTNKSTYYLVGARNDSCLFRKQPCGQHAATQGSHFAVHLQDVVHVTPSWLVITCSPSAVFLLSIPPIVILYPQQSLSKVFLRNARRHQLTKHWKQKGGSFEILQSLNPLTIPECYVVELGDQP